jgi:hypothetical protein
LDIILVGYRAKDTAAALRFCERGFSQVVGRRVLVLNRPNPHGEDTAKSLGWGVIAGSNRLGEFSGWQEGLALTAQHPATTLFLNDTVSTHRRFTSARKLAFLKAVRSANERAAIVGFSDRIDGRLVIAGLALTAWISSYCFVLTAGALMRLGNALYDEVQVDLCVPGGSASESFFANMSSDLVTHISRWLFVGGWHASGPLTNENSDRLTKKARSIVAEMQLSARCRAHGVDLVDPFEQHPSLHQIDRISRRLFGVLDPMARKGT